jgi:hypothetical protein
MFQLYKIVNGAGSPIDDRQVLSGVLNDETLHLEGAVTPNRFGGAGVFWPGGSANAYGRIAISYPRN